MPGRILIAETGTNNRISLKTLLSAEYFEVICVEDSSHLLRSVLKFHPDIILMSTQFGEIDGYETCKKLKLNAYSAHIPVVLHANQSSDIDWTKALGHLVDDIRRYPFDRMGLINQLRHMYRKKVEIDVLKNHANVTQQFGFNDITVETANNRLHKVNVTLINDPENETNFDLNSDIGHLHRLSSVCVSNQLNSKTELIVFQNAAAHFKLLSDVDAAPETRDIPKLCLVGEGDQAAQNRLFELGADECLPADAQNDHIWARIQSIIAIHRHKKELQNLLNERVKEACFDPLTGLYNRRHAERYMSLCFSNAKKDHRNLVAMMLDIDNFKAVNDTLGHSGGDAILRDLTDRLSTNLRPIDMLARIGGEEFLLIVPDASSTRAHIIAQRLLKLVAQTPFTVQGGKVSQDVTISIGIAHLNSDHKDASDLIECADKALFKAKQQGRNRAHIAA